MNIACIYSVGDYFSVEKPLHSPLDIPFGISYIASSLKNAGYEPHILVFTPESNIKASIKQFINTYQPKIFCLTSITSQFSLIRQIANEIKEIDSDIFIVLGGHHATLNPDLVIRDPSFDAICIGEGENAITQLASQIGENRFPTNIKNLWIKDKHKGLIEKNDQDIFIQDLDRLPCIDRDMWHQWIAYPHTVSSILIGRGCPNKCSYCSNHALAKISKGKYVRYRSPENIINEIRELLVKDNSIKDIYLENETISYDLKYIYNLCDYLENINDIISKPINFGTNMSITKKVLNNDELFKKLKRANFKFINVGLESGSEKIRSDILRRPKYSNNDIISFCKLARKYNIDINLYVMIGIPGEALLDFQETISCCRECSPNFINLNICYPYPGTDLYSFAKDIGIIKNNYLETKSERGKANLNLSKFSKKQIQKEYYLFYFKVYYNAMPLYKLIALTLRHFIASHPKIFSKWKRITGINMINKIKGKLFKFNSFSTITKNH